MGQPPGEVRALTRPKIMLNTSISAQTPSPVVLCMRSVLNTAGLADFGGRDVLCRIWSHPQTRPGISPFLFPSAVHRADRPQQPAGAESAGGPRVDSPGSRHRNKNKTESHSCDIVPGRDSVSRSGSVVVSLSGSVVVPLSGSVAVSLAA